MASEAATEPARIAELPKHPNHRGGRHPWYSTPLVVIGLVTALGGGLRFYHLSVPSEYVFDETYYAKDGCLDAGYPFKQCGLDSDVEQTVTVHPPLGRWIIAGSERLFGHNSFGWRFASATFGTLSVLLVALTAYWLLGSVAWSGVAGLLLATESLNFVQSRVAMLDIFLAAFALAGFACLVLDRRWIERRTPRTSGVVGNGQPHQEAAIERLDESEEEKLFWLPPDRPPSPIIRPWRLAAGLAFGAAIATKWSGGTALLGGILIALMWERTRRSDLGLPHPIREALRDESFGIFLFLVVVPLLVYMASYTPWFLDRGGFRIGDWVALQRSMADYSIHLRADHPYASKAWTWLLLLRPVAYYYKGTPPGTSAEILGIGNQVVFWGSLLTMPYLLLAWYRKKDWRPGLILVAFLSQYLPWFVAARTNFLFYMTPMTPFMVLAMTYTLHDLAGVGAGQAPLWSRERGWFAGLAAFWVVAAAGVFVFFLPVLTGRTIPYEDWHLRMWFPGWI